MRWFRFYYEVVEDPKVQKLPGDLFKVWVNLLCIAGKHGGLLPSAADIAFALRSTEKKIARHLSALVEAELIDEKDGALQPHNWNGRQFASDDSGNRVTEHRKRKRNGVCNGGVTANVTPPDTEQNRTDSETEQKDGATSAPDVPLSMVNPPEGDWSAALFRQGLAWLAGLLGEPKKKLRPFLGQCLKLADDDHRKVFDLLAEAQRSAIADPRPWLIARLGGKHERSGPAHRDPFLAAYTEEAV